MWGRCGGARSSNASMLVSDSPWSDHDDNLSGRGCYGSSCDNRAGGNERAPCGPCPEYEVAPENLSICWLCSGNDLLNPVASKSGEPERFGAGIQAA